MVQDECIDGSQSSKCTRKTDFGQTLPLLSAFLLWQIEKVLKF